VWSDSKISLQRDAVEVNHRSATLVNKAAAAKCQPQYILQVARIAQVD